MITSSAQSSPLALSLEQGNPGRGEDPVGFHGREIHQLSAEMLLDITRYLSMRDVLAFGQVCRDLRVKLVMCGVITDIWNYLSLPKHRKWTIHRLVTDNRPLLDHLRNNPAGYSKFFPIQHIPAIYTKYASHFREHTIRASSVDLVSIGCLDAFIELTFSKLNRQHSCLIHDGDNDTKLYVWTNQKNGCWEKEHMIDYQSYSVAATEHGTGILIIGGELDGKSYLSILERNERGEWNDTQKLYLKDISLSLESHDILQIHLAENQQVMLCEVTTLEFADAEVLMFDRDIDGQWRSVFRFQCPEIDDFQFRFTQDCQHIALFNGKLIVFVSKQDDRTWITTGEIKSESSFDKKNLEFSVDDHHFVAWGDKRRGRRGQCGLLEAINDFHVLVASRNDQGQWVEVLRLTRSSDSLTPPPHASFSPDGKHLFVCINNELVILSLHEGQWVSTINVLEPWDGRRCKIKTTMDPSVFMVTSNRMAWIYAMDSSGVWNKQHEFSCAPEFSPKISSDGNTAICLDHSAKQMALWSRSHAGKWIEQNIPIFAIQVQFSPDGSLVALTSSRQLMVFGLTAQSRWQKKSHQYFHAHINKVRFSPCGRSIRVDYLRGDSVHITFWKVVPKGS